MQSFVQGVLMGLGVSVPIGPVNVLIMSYALRSYTKALCLGLGAMSADTLYLALSAFGISQLAKIPIVFACISVFGAAFLLYIALGIYRDAKRSVQLKSVERGSHAAVFGKGFLLNIFNPYVIMFWLSVSVSIGREHFWLALAGLVCGILSWITLFALAVYKSRAKISDRAARAFAYISALILLFFALKLIYAVIFGKILN
ncbi:MAG: LysE family translocator [Campylobacter sp.]|nr:LysE family translocator [Campylobacter sp.]